MAYEDSVLEDSTDLRTQLSKVAKSGADALYFAVYPKNAVPGLKQMKDIALKIPVVGADSLSSDDTVKSGVANGIIYTIGHTENSEAFQKKIKSLPGKADLSISAYAAAAYDTVKMIAAAMEKAKSDDGEAVKNALTQLSFSGESQQTVHFNADRELDSPKFDIKTVKDNASVDYPKESK